MVIIIRHSEVDSHEKEYELSNILILIEIQIFMIISELEDAYENQKVGSMMFVDQVIMNSTAFIRFFYDFGVRAMTLGSGCNE